jgi:hypothetical protein
MEKFTIINDKEFNNERILHKWNHVLNTLNVEDEELRLFISLYAEYFQMEHTKNNSTWTPYPVSPPKFFLLNEKFDISRELLPTNIKILSKLNLKDKHYEIKNSLPERIIVIPISSETYSDIKNTDINDVLWKLENILENKLVNDINLELETNNEIYIDSLIDSIMIKDISFKSEESTDTSVWEIKYEIVLTTKYESIRCSNLNM